MTDSPNSWIETYWNNDSTPWHIPKPNERLVKHWLNVTNGRTELQVLFPLCGASVDLAWLYRQGHTVVGVEGSRKAVEKLFSDAGVEHEVVQVNNDTWRFKSTDSRLIVYVADFFSITPQLVGHFDAVFDRGALEALCDENSRLKYVEVISGCLKKEFSYILCGYDYDGRCKEGPPRPLPPGVVRSLFQGVGNVSILHKEENTDEGLRARWKLPLLHEYTYLIKNL